MSQRKQAELFTFEDQRNSFTNIHSGSQDVLDTVLGPLEEPKKVEKKKDIVPPPKLKLGGPVMVTKPKEEKKKVEAEKPAPVEVCI